MSPVDVFPSINDAFETEPFTMWPEISSKVTKLLFPISKVKILLENLSPLKTSVDIFPILFPGSKRSGEEIEPEKLE